MSGVFEASSGSEVSVGGVTKNDIYTDNNTDIILTKSVFLQPGDATELLKYDDPTLQTATQTFSSSGLGCVYQAITQQLPITGTEQKGAFAGSSSTTQGEISCIYENLTAGSLYQSTGGVISNAGGSTATITSSNISGASSQLLRMETPSVGDAKIEHVVVGATRNLSISSQGQLSLTAPSSVSLTSSSGPASVAVINSAVVLSGGTQSYITTGNSTTASPAYTLTNTNATITSCPIISTLNQGHVQTGTATDYLYRQQHIGKNISGTQITFGGIDCISRNVGVGNEDGVLAFNCAVNGTPTKVLELNGNESEINAFQALDMNGQAIKSGSGNLTISTTSSTGAGTITLAPKALGNLILLNIPTSSAGLPTGALWNNLGVLNIVP